MARLGASSGFAYSSPNRQRINSRLRNQKVMGWTHRPCSFWLETGPRSAFACGPVLVAWVSEGATNLRSHHFNARQAQRMRIEKKTYVRNGWFSVGWLRRPSVGLLVFEIQFCFMCGRVSHLGTRAVPTVGNTLLVFDDLPIQLVGQSVDGGVQIFTFGVGKQFRTGDVQCCFCLLPLFFDA